MVAKDAPNNDIGRTWKAVFFLAIPAAAALAITTLRSNSSLLVSTEDYTTPTETLSGAVTFLITGEGTLDSDVVKETFDMIWMPQA